MESGQLMRPFKQVLLQVAKVINDFVSNPLLVGSVKSAHGENSHAMILDKISNRQFVFKNTYSENKKFTIQVDHENSPDELFFVHMELTDEKIAEIQQRQAQTNWNKKYRKIWRTIFDNLFVFESKTFRLFPGKFKF